MCTHRDGECFFLERSIFQGYSSDDKAHVQTKRSLRRRQDACCFEGVLPAISSPLGMKSSRNSDGE